MGEDAPLVVVGGGVAGLCTALAASPRRVLLLERGKQGEGSATALAQGGIAAAIGRGDGVDAHVADTLAAGAFRNDGALVRVLAAAAPDAVAWLQAQGVAFDAGPDGAPRLGREGGHRADRIVHAGGDATGARVLAALQVAVDAAPHIERRGGIDVDGLMLRGRRVCGVRLGGAGGGEWLPTDAVVLATGGIGALFARTTNPPGADGSGLALALAAGARMRDLEFVQFHPTALDVALPSLPLVTEALRGRGARLVGIDGAALMEGLHPLGDLAPRDVVARRVWQAGQEGGARLDARWTGIDWPNEFPTVLAHCRAHGIDPAHEPIPVTAAAHFHMGGLACDPLGRTTLHGLYAVGEVAANGVHGANRLASNSLLEGVVFGRRLGAHLAAHRTAVRAVGEVEQVERGGGLDPVALARLRELMWDAAGPVRTGSALAAAEDALAALAETGWQARLAAAIVRAARRRRVCLGAHWRSDTALEVLGDADGAAVSAYAYGSGG
ncbi:L-aspartate oxidase [Novilysobacter arseniciresistens]|uniref:L-aspartate oxidase n=1 Tax=Novilysobacter arseniciresistens TaxID=1385522 RepID=UPI00068CDAAD|nr:FAD-binding protein [Lysobacter arseniciresistens]